jgi:hypothetical protein
MKSPGAFVGSVSTGMTADAPALIIEGEFQGRLVLLPVCLEPPKGFEIIDLTGPGGANVREKQSMGWPIGGCGSPLLRAGYTV